MNRHFAKESSSSSDEGKHRLSTTTRKSSINLQSRAYLDRKNLFENEDKAKSQAFAEGKLTVDEWNEENPLSTSTGFLEMLKHRKSLVPDILTTLRLKQRRVRRIETFVRDANLRPHEEDFQEPYIIVENLIEWDPSFTSKNKSFWELPSKKLLQTYATYIHQHKLTLEICLLNGWGYKFKYISRKWNPKLLTVKTLEKRPGKDNKHWIGHLSKLCYGTRLSYPHHKRKLRTLITNKVLEHWNVYKNAIKQTYQPYILFFAKYDPNSSSKDVHAEAKWVYESLHYDAYMDFTLFEISIICREFGLALTVIEITIDGRFFIRKQSQGYFVPEKGLHIWAREYLDPDSMCFSRYFLTKLEPLSCPENKDSYNSFPNCELRLTYNNHKLSQYRLTQMEDTRIGLTENWNILEKLRNKRQEKSKHRYLLKRAKAIEAAKEAERKAKGDAGDLLLPTASITTIQSVNEFVNESSDYNDYDDDDDEGSESVRRESSHLRIKKKVMFKSKTTKRRKVHFDSRVPILIYKFFTQQTNVIFRFVKWLTGYEIPWLKVRVPCYVRDNRHVPFQIIKDIELKEPKKSMDVEALKSVLKNSDDRSIGEGFYAAGDQNKLREETFSTPFKDQVPHDYFIKKVTSLGSFIEF